MKQRLLAYLLTFYFTISFRSVRFVVLAMALFCVAMTISDSAIAQCSICTKTAQQMGEKSAKGLNSGILYLAFMPMAIVGIIGYRWWKSNKEAEGE